MELERIEALLKLMAEHDVSELKLQEGDGRISLRRGAISPVMTAVPHVAAPVAAPSTGGPAASSEQHVNSPMVGTFYRAPKPGSPPFVSVGDAVHKGQVLCILEAMKLMNELESEVDGKVAEILVENAQPVQFGQPLFRIEPA